MSDCIDLLMVGKSGNGKSSLGNLLAGRNVFIVSEDTTSLTLEMDAEEFVFKGNKIRIVDGPGVGDTRFNKLERLKQMERWTEDAINMSPDGYHAILLVVRFGGRCSDEDVETVEILKKTFGPDLVKKHCVLVMTNGDDFEKQSRRNPQTFEQWCGRQEGAFRSLLTECRGRVVLVDNYAEGAARDLMITELLKTVEKLGGVRYTDEKFAKAAMERLKAQVEAKKNGIQKEISDEISMILKALDCEKVKKPFEKSSFLDLQGQCDKLENHVTKEDNGTGVLQDLIGNIRGAKQTIASEMSSILKQKKMEEAMAREKKEMEEAMAKQKKEMEEAAERGRQEVEEERQRFQRQMMLVQQRQAANSMAQLLGGALNFGAMMFGALMADSTPTIRTSRLTIAMPDDPDSDSD